MSVPSIGSSLYPHLALASCFPLLACWLIPLSGPGMPYWAYGYNFSHSPRGHNATPCHARTMLVGFPLLWLLFFFKIIVGLLFTRLAVPYHTCNKIPLP
ncbi:hypothetical protein BJY52DRAFT_208182 [Lactarius psammicola]|nr:hypothetical protein BJY52DRAFT_208182 [Lactarius psammicola]